MVNIYNLCETGAQFYLCGHGHTTCRPNPTIRHRYQLTHHRVLATRNRGFVHASLHWAAIRDSSRFEDLKEQGYKYRLTRPRQAVDSATGPDDIALANNTAVRLQLPGKTNRYCYSGLRLCKPQVGMHERLVGWAVQTCDGRLENNVGWLCMTYATS
jgi:hypothetical protein